jgi:hypothetical protein
MTVIDTRACPVSATSGWQGSTGSSGDRQKMWVKPTFGGRLSSLPAPLHLPLHRKHQPRQHRRLRLPARLIFSAAANSVMLSHSPLSSMRCQVTVNEAMRHGLSRITCPNGAVGRGEESWRCRRSCVRHARACSAFGCAAAGPRVRDPRRSSEVHPPGRAFGTGGERSAHVRQEGEKWRADQLLRKAVVGPEGLEPPTKPL